MARVRFDVAVDVRISQRQLDLLVRDGGPVHEYMEDVAHEAFVDARRRCPQSSGELFAGIQEEVSTNGRDICTATLGTEGVGHAYYYLLGHGPIPATNHRPIGAALVERGVAFGMVNRKPGKKWRGTPRMYTNGPVAGFDGNNILLKAMNAALARNGLGTLHPTIR